MWCFQAVEYQNYHPAECRLSYTYVHAILTSKQVTLS